MLWLTYQVVQRLHWYLHQTIQTQIYSDDLIKKASGPEDHIYCINREQKRYFPKTKTSLFLRKKPFLHASSGVLVVCLLQLYSALLHTHGGGKLSLLHPHEGQWSHLGHSLPLQNIPFAEHSLCWKLPLKKNQIEEKTIRRVQFTHPYFDQKAINSQKDLHLIQNKNNILFCGSYFGYGFHEDGIKSSLDMMNYINV